MKFMYWIFVELIFFSYILVTNAELGDEDLNLSSEDLSFFGNPNNGSDSAINISGTTTTESKFGSDIENNTNRIGIRKSVSKTGKQVELQDENGRDAPFEALASKKSLDKSIISLSSLTVDLTEGSSLLLNPNARQEIYFEVTNNLNGAQRVSFTVKDEMRILLEIDKYSTVLGPHETTTVRVTLLPRPGVGSDKITFLATGSEQVKKEIIVDIDTNYRSDTDYPDVDYTYSSDCTDVLLSKCERGSWTIKVTARDADSGLMLLTSIPRGLYFPDGYIGGTKEEVTGYYSDSCCKPDLQIIAIDRMNNIIVKQANAYKAPLSFWAIIAIILVSLIILVVIATVVFFCVKRCKSKEGDSFDLPTYRGMGTRF